jgi:peptide/nickel transport system substrate-binding protein
MTVGMYGDGPDPGLMNALDSALTRRGLLMAGAQGAVALTGAALLAGCGSGHAGSATTASSASTASSAQVLSSGGGTPSYGGTMIVGEITAGTAEQLAPSFSVSPDAIRSCQLYDRLFDLENDLTTLQPRLALSAEPNADASLWTLTLRDGVVWHDGKPFGADDVVWTIRSWQSPQNLTFGAFDGIIDYNGVRKRGPLTVEVPLVAPVGQFPSLLGVIPSYGMTQNGQTLRDLQRNPIGTGPFKYESFQPGVTSTFVANKDYWEQGKPYVDRLIINSSFTDPNALLEALLSGQIHVLPHLPEVQAKEQMATGQITVLNSNSPANCYIYMNTKAPPFNDVRVRQAVRLLADRDALVEIALNGLGAPANDLMGEGAQYFASDLKRSQDIEQAKSLLKSAGQENLAFAITTAQGTSPGGVEAATLLAEQAQAAGVTISVRNVSPAQYYNPPGYPWLMGQDYLEPVPSLTAWYRLAFVEYNETRWNVNTDSALAAAIRALDPAEAGERWREAQLEQFNMGGHLIWASQNLLDGVAKTVHGLRAGPVQQLNLYRLLDGWLVQT